MRVGSCTPEGERVPLLDRLHWGPSVYWTWACIAILASGALTLVPIGHWTLPGGYALGTLYPALLLTGALGYARRHMPRWLPIAAFALGAGRGFAQLAGQPGLAHGLALAVEPALVLGAAWVVRGDPARERRQLSQRLLAPALLVIAVLEAASALSMLKGGALPEPLIAAWFSGGPLLLAIQLGAWGAVSRRDLERNRELLEQRVEEQTERYRVVSELSSDYSFSYLIGPDLDITAEWVGDAQGRVTGYTAQELEGMGWLELVPEEGREQLKGQVAAMMRGELTELEMHIITKSGEERWLQVRVEAKSAGPAGSLRLVGAGREITDRVLAERERLRLETRLQETQRLESLGRLAGGIAHDFNNALTVIRGNSALALEELAAGRNVDPLRLQRIDTAAEFAAGLTEQILNYSGKAVVSLEPLDLSSVVRETLDLLHASLRGESTLETHLAEGLPCVEGDVTQVRQVLVNLVTNASHALGEEGGVISVRTGTRGLAEHELAETLGSSDAGPGHYVLLEVSDTGPGLDAATRSRIFEPFFTTRGDGRGLGLAAVIGIVRAHGGVIHVGSEPGHGTTFQVLLPRSARSTVQAPRRDPVPVTTHGRVLVVDDDEAVLEVATTFLERAGFDVLNASRARVALDLLGDPGVEIDAVVLDLVMPGVSTEALLTELKKLRPGLPVVLTSGYDREQAARRFADGGPGEFVRKPYGPDELVAGVQAALAGH